MLTTAMLPLWVGFLVLILALLAVDLGVSHKSPKVPSPKEALWWSAFWISLGLLFNVAIYFIYEGGWVPEGGPEQLTGRRASLFFLTGYLVEKLLSLDNLFVMAAILSAFRIPGAAQHRVLFWGILGALVLRGLMIFAGTAAVQRFSWLVYPLALLLVVTGGKLLRSGVSSEDGPATDGLLVRLVKRVIPVRDEPTGLHFFIKVGGRWAATMAPTCRPRQRRFRPQSAGRARPLGAPTAAPPGGTLSAAQHPARPKRHGPLPLSKAMIRSIMAPSSATSSAGSRPMARSGTPSTFPTSARCWSVVKTPWGVPMSMVGSKLSFFNAAFL